MTVPVAYVVMMAKSKRSRTAASPRGANTLQVLRVVGLLVSKPWRPMDLAVELDVSYRTVERLLRALNDAKVGLESERGEEGTPDAKCVYYSIPREALKKKLGV